MEAHSVNVQISKSMGIEKPRVLYLTHEILEKKYKRVFLTVDWHIWIKDRDVDIKPCPVRFRLDGEKIITQYQALDEDDLLIHMGDIVDDEFYEFFDEEMQSGCFDEIFQDIKCHKILIRGNNDPVSADWLYEEQGFEIYDGVVVDDIVLTHMPIDISMLNGLFNVHGHSHGHMHYWRVPYTKHLDLWDNAREPVPFDRAILDKKLDEYKDHVIDISHLHLQTKDEFMSWRGKPLKDKTNY